MGCCILDEEPSIYFKHWYDDKQGWHQFSIPHTTYTNPDDLISRYKHILMWIHENIENCSRHARWTITTTEIIARFRYERDLIKFVLRWS